MDKICNAIKCNICKSIFESPVILPCNHSICKDHTETSEEIKCNKCGRNHKVPNHGFPENESLAEIIAAQVHKINLGKVHEKAKEDTESLYPLIKQVGDILADPSHQMNEEVDHMKNQVHLRREELKLKIDQEAEKIVNKIEEYALKFDTYLGDSKNKIISSQLVESKKSVERTLEDCRNRLNEINVDDDLWKSISEKTTFDYNRLANNLDNLIKTLVFTDLDDLKQHTEFFRTFDISFNFIAKPLPLNSLIIGPVCSKIEELNQLCEFPVDQNWELLYRGSENNFSWTEFHAKCDNQTPTLVIVKSKDGSIFGGYTQAQWKDPNPNLETIETSDFIYCNERKKYLSKFKADPNAFLFIFKYPSKRKNEIPVKVKVSEGKHAIYCDLNDGPSFGKFDLVIQEENLTRMYGYESYFNIGSSYKLVGNQDKVTCLNSKKNNFDLEEIEIFQKI